MTPAEARAHLTQTFAARAQTLAERTRQALEAGWTITDGQPLYYGTPVLGVTHWGAQTVTLHAQQLAGQYASTLTHELNHVERGCMDSPAEEATVEELTARQLIGPDDLTAALVLGADSTDEIADALGVDNDLVLLRLQLLTAGEWRAVYRYLDAHERTISRPIARRKPLTRRKPLRPT